MKRSVVVARASSVEKNRSLWRRVISQERTRELTLGLIFTRISPRAVRPSQLSSSRYLRAPKIHRRARKNRTSDALLHHFMDGFHVHVFIRPERGVQIAPPLV